MRHDESFTAFVTEQLGGLGPVRAKSMFGGHALYLNETLFGMEYKGRVYFRVDDATRPRYVERGMKTFSPGPSMTMKAYHEVPLDVLESAGELVRWAREAVRAVPAKAAGKNSESKRSMRRPVNPVGHRSGRRK